VYPTGTTTLAIDVTPMVGGISYAGAHGALCAPGSLIIPATVHLVTADGGFNETWQESLSSNDGQSLTFYQDLQKAPPAGSFRVTYTGSETWTSTETILTATFDAQGARGNVQYATEGMLSAAPNSGGGGGLIVHAASWVPLVGDAGTESRATDPGVVEAGGSGAD
jgi:hypothetical protein